MKIRPSARVSWQIYENKVYILDETDETMTLLDNAGFQFWIIMLTTPRYSDVLLKLKSVFIFESERMVEELKSFVDELVKNGIIEVDNE